MTRPNIKDYPGATREERGRAWLADFNKWKSVTPDWEAQEAARDAEWDTTDGHENWLAMKEQEAVAADRVEIAAEHERITAFLNSPDEIAHNKAMAEIHGGEPVSVSLADVLVQP